MPEFKNPRERIKYLDQLIISNKKYSAGEMLDKLNDWMENQEYSPISRRQFMKDIDKMKELASYDGIDMVYSRIDRQYVYKRMGEDGEYYKDLDYSLSGIPINKQDIELLTQAIAILKEIHGLKKTKELEVIIGRLSEKIGVKVSDLEGVIHFDAVPNLKGIEHLNTLLNKIIAKQVLVMHYQPYDAPEMSYIFHPYFLKEYNNRWYVFGWNEESDAIYNVPLDRIVAYEDDHMPFNEEKRINPDEYFKPVVGVTRNEGKPQKLQYKFKRKRASYVRTKPLHHSQVVMKETDEFVIYQIKVIPNKELEAMILSFGDDVERVVN